MNQVSVEKMKVVELKEKLKELGVSTCGVKKELVSRLIVELEKKRNEEEEESSENEVEDEESEDAESLDEAESEEESESEVESEGEQESEIFEVETNDKSKAAVEGVNKVSTRGKNNDYDFVSKYDSAEAAQKVIETEKNWKKGNKKETTRGVKQFFNCKYDKSCDCQAKCVLLYHDDEDGVSHYKSVNEHNDHISEKTHGIIGKYAETIDLIYDLFQKPKEIKRQLLNKFPNDKKEDFPTDQQLRNYLAYKRTKQGYKAKLNLAELEKWCLEHEKIPDDMDEMFVKRSFRVDNQTHKVIFFIFFTTKRLLSLAKKTSHICADTTWKLIQHGYPLLVVGTTDKAKVFHPFGIAMCANEKEEAYTFIFKALYDSIYDIYNYEYEPTTLIGDAADAITNGFKEVFDNLIKRVMCWFHMVKAFEEHATFISIPSPLKENVKQDICSLQLSESDEIFESSFQLFKEKWLKVNSNKAPTKKFLEYFEAEWINKHNGWYEGYAPG